MPPENPLAQRTLALVDLPSPSHDEGLVYEVTKQFFDALASGPERPSLGFVELDQAPATSIPLHDGAARYYRERELQR